MSLAEDLLADVEEDGDEDMEDLMPKEEEDDDEIDEITEAQPIAAYNRVTDVAKLMESDKYKRLINELQTQLALTEIPKLRTPLEMDPQYILVVSLSELAAEIDQEVQVIHKFIRDKYEKRFPELESLVMMPFDYIRTVKILGNDIQSRSQNKELLGEVLAPATVMVVSVTASTSQGKPLESEELEIVMEACDMAEALQEERVRMHQYVEQRMALIAPNLCAIVGAGTAAMLVSQAGGLGPLAKQPACNLQILGKQKRALAGFSTASILPHAGFIYFHPIVQTLPPDYRQKATKIIAAKCTLAARVDSLHESPDGGIGRDLSAQIQQKIDKMLEPPPVKNNKALPKPLDKASKKRGGRRVRKTKEMMGMTELRRKTNRMNFGELQEDVSQEHIGFTLGQAASTSLAGGGRIRGAVVDNKTRVKMSQKMQRQLERQRQQLGGATSIRSKLSGTQSSISFTPVQGLEIVNQNRDQQPASSGTSSTYFSATSNFIKVQTPLNRLGANSKLE
jgi:U4/U6 small nuclear ribonucleoprotein PRP31